MEVFWVDIVAGVILVIGLLSIIMGIRIFRYRRGKGPISLMVGGSMLLIGSGMWFILIFVEHPFDPYWSILPWSWGFLILIITFFLWRGRK